MADFDAVGIEAALGHRYRYPSLLRQALTHRSRTAEVPEEPSNERLEFLGDAVLGLVVAEELYRSWGLEEGAMAKVRAAVVNEHSLAGIAGKLGLDESILLGRGEETSGGREKPSILADTMEAVLGSLFLDGGLEVARRLILREWGDLIVDRAADPGRRDYKTRLQEVLARRGLVPAYEVEGSGPDHDREFVAVVVVAGEPVGRGTGSSKKRAEQAAAERALAVLASRRDA
jgi:ribonuclease-3